MRILEVCRSLPCHRDGGLEWHALDVVEALEAEGATVAVLTTPPPRTGPDAFAPMRAAGGIHVHGEVPGRYSPRFFATLRRRVRELHEETPVDVIHAQGFAGVVLAGAEDLPPVVTTVHGTLFSETPLRREQWEQLGAGERLRSIARHKHRVAFVPLWKRFLATAPRLVVDSEFTRGELAREAGAPVAATVVPLGVDATRYPAEGTERDERLTITMAGRHEPLKGHAVGMEALALLARRTSRPLRVHVVGEGPETPRLRALAAEMLPPSVECRFEGRVPTRRLAALLAASDLFLNPDRGAPAFGLANAEALLCGARVLALATGATPEVVCGDADGDLLPEDVGTQAAAWALALERTAPILPEDRSIRAERMTRARARFDRALMARRLLAVFAGAHTRS